jgi:hypothetical protein
MKDDLSGVKVLRPKWWGMKNILEAGGWITLIDNRLIQLISKAFYS